MPWVTINGAHIFLKDGESPSAHFESARAEAGAGTEAKYAERRAAGMNAKAAGWAGIKDAERAKVASAKADAASDTAKTAEEHAEAARLHRHAAEQNEKAGIDAEHHHEMAAEHQEHAERLASKPAKNRRAMVVDRATGWKGYVNE
jgi:hypothetical protein